MSDARAARFLWPAGLLFGTVAVSAIIILLLGQDPVEAFGVFVSGALRWPAGLGSSVSRGAILVLYALGVTLSFRAGLLNIGAEGQSRVGSAAAVAFTLGAPGAFFAAHPWIGIPLMLLAGGVGGALWSLIAGALKRWRGVSEVVSTLMLNFLAMPFVKYLLTPHGLPDARGVAPRGWLQGDTNLLKNELSPALQLYRWGGTEFHSWIFIVSPLVLAAHFFLFRTPAGLHLRALGFNARAARACGVGVENLSLGVFAMSGAFAGVAGAMSVMAAGALEAQPPFADYGYLSISVALVAALRPLWLLPSAFLFAAMIVGAGSMEESAHVPHWVVFLLHGLLILAILARGTTKSGALLETEARA